MPATSFQDSLLDSDEAAAVLAAYDEAAEDAE